MATYTKRWNLKGWI